MFYVISKSIKRNQAVSNQHSVWECPLEYLDFALFRFVIGSKISRQFLSQLKPTVIFFRVFPALATGPHVLASTRDWFMLVLGTLLIGHSNWQTTQAIRVERQVIETLWSENDDENKNFTENLTLHSFIRLIIILKKALVWHLQQIFVKEPRVSKPSKDNSLLLLHG